MFNNTASMFVLALVISASGAQAETVFPAKLAGHALIPAATFLPAPADASDDAKSEESA